MLEAILRKEDENDEIISKLEEKEVEENQSVNNPTHYKKGEFECIDIAEHMTFNAGNALKYIWRAGKKDKAQVS